MPFLISRDRAGKHRDTEGTEPTNAPGPCQPTRLLCVTLCLCVSADRFAGPMISRQMVGGNNPQPPKESSVQSRESRAGSRNRKSRLALIPQATGLTPRGSRVSRVESREREECRIRSAEFGMAAAASRFILQSAFCNLHLPHPSPNPPNRVECPESRVESRQQETPTAPRPRSSRLTPKASSLAPGAPIRTVRIKYLTLSLDISTSARVA